MNTGAKSKVSCANAGHKYTHVVVPCAERSLKGGKNRTYCQENAAVIRVREGGC